MAFTQNPQRTYTKNVFPKWTWCVMMCHAVFMTSSMESTPTLRECNHSPKRDSHGPFYLNIPIRTNWKSFSPKRTVNQRRKPLTLKVLILIKHFAGWCKDGQSVRFLSFLITWALCTRAVENSSYSNILGVSQITFVRLILLLLY